MSIASLIHEHSYHYSRQIQDGILRSSQDAESSSNAAKRSTRKRQRRAEADAVTTTSWTPPSAASYYIPTLPGLDSASTLTLFGGHIPSTITASGPVDTDVDASTPSSGVDNGNAHLFFFLAKAKHIAEKEKLVIWLNGGGQYIHLEVCPCTLLTFCRPRMLVLRWSAHGDWTIADGGGQ